MQQNTNKKFSLISIIFILTMTIISCGSGGGSSVLSISECEAEGGTVVLSSVQQTASCEQGQFSIGLVQSQNFSGICCKPKPP